MNGDESARKRHKSPDKALLGKISFRLKRKDYEAVSQFADELDVTVSIAARILLHRALREIDDIQGHARGMSTHKEE